MTLPLILHIAAGMLGLASGAVALVSLKGGVRHRQSGLLFVASMLPMCGAGLLMSAINGTAPAINIPAALLTALLVITGLSTVRALPSSLNFLHTGSLLGTSIIGAGCLILALIGTGRRGMTAPLVVFGIVGLIAGIGDLRVLRGIAPRGPRRLARHLWRMCFALFVASGSFFLGQAKVFPQPLRVRPLLAVPVLLVLGTMVYWLWEMRRRQRDTKSVRTLSSTISTPTAIMR